MTNASEHSKTCSLAKKQPRVKIKKLWYFIFPFHGSIIGPDSSQWLATRCSRENIVLPALLLSSRGGEEELGGGGRDVLLSEKKGEGKWGLNTDLKRGQKICVQHLQNKTEGMRKGIKESTLNWGEFKGSQKGRNGFESRGPGCLWGLKYLYSSLGVGQGLSS